MTRLRQVATLLPLVLVTPAAAAPGAPPAAAQVPAADDATVLTPGELYTGELDALEELRRTFVVELPPTAVALTVRMRCLEAELDLVGARGTPVEAHEDVHYWPDEESVASIIRIDRFSVPPIGADRFYFEVFWAWQDLPRHEGRSIRHVPFTLETHVVDVRVDGVLQPGEPLRTTVEPASGGFRTFQLDVPADARVLRIDLFDARDDLALLAAPKHPVVLLGPQVARTSSGLSRKTLLLTPATQPPLVPGRWFVDVADSWHLGRASSARLVASFDAAPPEELLEIPPLPEPVGDGPLARGLTAVVEVLTGFGGGSGTLVTPDGLILTAAHVVENPAGEPIADGLVIAAPLDPRRPAVELFRARVVRCDRDRDLALLEVVSGFYGQPLPDGYRFPFVPLGDPARLAIGDPLSFLGYPTTGGTGSRVTITCTRGIVSGFEELEVGLLMKTDGEITGGSSGGAALDARGELVGVPTSVMELGSSQMAFVQPLWLVPDAWRAELERRLEAARGTVPLREPAAAHSDAAEPPIRDR